MAADYITLAELKNTAEMSSFNFADGDMTVAISAASRGIDEYCDRVFYPEGTAVRYFTPDGWCVPVDDFVTVATVQADYDHDFVYEQTWSQGTQFTVAPYNAAARGKPYEELELNRLRLPYLPVWQRSVAVTAGWGWEAVPSPVKEATTILSTRLLRRAREAPFAIVISHIDQSALRIGKTDPDVAFLLEPFVKGKGVLAA